MTRSGRLISSSKEVFGEVISFMGYVREANLFAPIDYAEGMFGGADWDVRSNTAAGSVPFADWPSEFYILRPRA